MRTVRLRGRLGCSRGVRRRNRIHPGIRDAGATLAMGRIEKEVLYCTIQYFCYMQCLSARLNVEGRHAGDQESCG